MTKAARQAAKRQQTLESILEQLQELAKRITALEKAVKEKGQTDEPQTAQSKSNR